MKSKYGENSLAVQTTNKHIKELNNQISQSENKLNGFSERISKNSTTLANQAKQASKVASSYKEVARQSRGLSTTRLGSMFKAGSQQDIYMGGIYMATPQEILRNPFLKRYRLL